MQDIFARVPSLKQADDAEPTPEEIAAAEKADRIKFHRDHVRNGPVNFKQPSNGQVRRAQRRAAKAQARKAFRGRVRAYFEDRAEEANLRGNLQRAGVLQYHDGSLNVNRERGLRGVLWLAKHYAPVEAGSVVEVTEELLLSGVRAGLERYLKLSGDTDADVEAHLVDYELPVVPA